MVYYCRFTTGTVFSWQTTRVANLDKLATTVPVIRLGEYLIEFFSSTTFINVEIDNPDFLPSNIEELPKEVLQTIELYSIK